jgi:rhamnosyltransferase
LLPDPALRAAEARPLLPPSGVCAVLITYHPGEEFLRVLERISDQVGALVIVDNGSDDAELGMLQSAAAGTSIQLICNGENLGIASALNIGIHRAASLGYAWVLLLDQDTLVSPDLVASLLAIQASFPAPERLAVIGAGYAGDEALPSAPSGEDQSGAAWRDVESVITSGSLLSVAAFGAIGPFREEFFIDHVDTDYCRRARASGFRVIKSESPLMSHAIGAPTTHRVLWMSKRTTNHGPDRRYYFTRNDTVLLRENGQHPWGTWLLKSLLRSFRICKRILLYEPMKTRKVGAVMHGWWDGVRGRLGPRGGSRDAARDVAAMQSAPRAHK